MVVNCKFSTKFGYTCGFYNQEIHVDTKIEGVHKPGKTNEDVQHFVFVNCKMPQLPTSICCNLKNIETLQIESSNFKSITKFDLKQFENLKQIHVFRNDLEFLPSDLFKYTKKIEEINFSTNKIKFIGPKIFDSLENLRFVNLEGNVNIDCFFGDRNTFLTAVTLDDLKEKIRIDCKVPLDERDMLKKYGRDPDECGNSKKGFLRDMEQFLMEEDFKDFTIKVANRDFKVHKFIFAARSQTFAELIKNNPEAEDLELQDIPIEIFECILSFVYNDELPETENICEVFAAAGTLKIKGLMEQAAEILTSKMENEKNLVILFKMLSLANKFPCDELKLKAFEKIKKHFPDKELRDELANQPEKLKPLIDAKLVVQQLLNHVNDVNV